MSSGGHRRGFWGVVCHQTQSWLGHFFFALCLPAIRVARTFYWLPRGGPLPFLAAVPMGSCQTTGAQVTTVGKSTETRNQIKMMESLHNWFIIINKVCNRFWQLTD